MQKNIQENIFTTEKFHKHIQSNMNSVERVKIVKSTKSKKNKKSKPLGFTLLEVMVSSAILLVGIAAFVSAYASAMNLNEHQRHMTHVLDISEAVTEEMLLMFNSDQDLKDGEHLEKRFYDKDGIELTNADDENRFFTVGWIVTANDPVPNVRKLEIEISWEERGVKKTFLVTTFRS